MLKKLLYSIVIIILIFISVGFFLPKQIHVERSITIARPASMLFVLLNSYTNFNSWSPWAARDPSAEYTITGPGSGVGARLAWVGDPRLTGNGEQEIIESVPDSLIRMRFQFENQGEAISYYALNEANGSTGLTWGFDTDVTEGQSFFGGIMARYFGLFFDRWIGSDYEKGLVSLKSLAESLPKADFSDLEVEILDVDPQTILYVQSISSQAPGDIADSLAESYRQIMSVIVRDDLQVSGQPMAISRAWDETGYSFDAAIPVLQVTLEPGGNVKVGNSPAGKAIRIVHRGPYDKMKPTYEKVAAYMGAHGLQDAGVSWEHYISDPGVTPTDQLVTHVYFLLQD